jgi:predicted PurR-regulated permease PerM
MQQDTHAFPNPTQRRTFFWCALTFALGILLWLLSPMLMPFLLGAIFAYILHPGAVWLVRHKVPRSMATLLMILILMFVIVFFVLLVLIVVQTQLPQLQQQIPSLLAQGRHMLAPYAIRLGIAPDAIFSNLTDFASAHLSDSANAVLPTLWNSLRASGNMMMALLSHLVITPLILYYLLFDSKKIFRQLCRLVPRRQRGRVRRLAHDMDQMLAQYLRGQWRVIGVLVVYYSVCLMLAGFEIALPVGIFTGVAVLIPYLGYFVGLTLALMAALLQFGNWYGVGAVALIYGVGQILESYFLTPRLIGERIGLHPLAVIFALLVFGYLFGFIGVLLALPLSAIMVTVLREIYRQYLSSALYKN